MNPQALFIEYQSSHGVDKTIELLVKALAEKEWQNPATHNLQQSLAKSGKDVLPVQVIEACKPKFSGALLEKNDERVASVLMPCRISVYEKEDGNTYIALLNTSFMIPFLPAAIADVMNRASDEITEIVSDVSIK